ncbi:hypothetical protein MBLNU459_g2573t1 [Dothideomycetes sp. NU459]
MVLVQLLHVPQAALAAYGLYVSYVCISNLRQYEDATKKAAEYSAEAERQLHATRTTQASGALAVLASLVVACTLSTASGVLPPFIRYSLSPVMLVGTLFARGHIKNFWSSATKVPFAKGYNEAISRTKEVMLILAYLEYSWVGMSLLGAMIGY